MRRATTIWPAPMNDTATTAAAADDDDELSAVDIDALQRAIALMLKDRDHGEHIRDNLRDEPWRDVAESCAFDVQCDRLALKPWQWPPSVSDGIGSEPEDVLAARLIRAGLSTYEPDPLAALAKAERPPDPPPRRSRSRRRPPR